MEPNKQDRIYYLELYGHDLNRWPVDLSAQQKQKITAMPEYAAALALDEVMNQMDWPSPSPNLKQKTLAQITALNERKTRHETVPPALFILIKKPAFLVTCVTAFFCLGLLSGTQFHVKTKAQIDYNYFALGSAYTAYGVSTENTYEE